MVSITLDLPDSIHEYIVNDLGNDAVGDFAISAMEELIDWLNADERPTSISDLETKRIYQIYKRIYKDILPTAEEIGQKFKLPMGRSRYIVQNLHYRYPDFMNRRRITALINALELEEVSEDGLPIAYIPKECAVYIQDIAMEMVLEKLISSKPLQIRVTEYIRIEMGKNDREPLLKRLYDDLKKLPE